MSRLDLVHKFGNEDAETFNKISHAYEMGQKDAVKEKCTWIKRNGEYAFQYITPCVAYSDVDNISGFKYCPYCGKKLDLVLEKARISKE